MATPTERRPSNRRDAERPTEALSRTRPGDGNRPEVASDYADLRLQARIGDAGGNRIDEGNRLDPDIRVSTQMGSTSEVSQEAARIGGALVAGGLIGGMGIDSDGSTGVATTVPRSAGKVTQKKIQL